MKNKELQPHQQRVVDESIKLLEKIYDLQKFIEDDSGRYKKLPNEEKGDLSSQLEVMNQYKSILDRRIRRFFF